MAVLAFLGEFVIIFALGFPWDGFELAAIPVMVGMFGSFLIMRSASLRDLVPVAEPSDDPSGGGG